MATTATQPVDVLKTRIMNAKRGEYRSIWHCLAFTARTGPLGFFKVHAELEGSCLDCGITMLSATFLWAVLWGEK